MAKAPAFGGLIVRIKPDVFVYLPEAHLGGGGRWGWGGGAGGGEREKALELPI